ncbi:hypothetical protein EIP86_000886 [Pleurotus ostreatoroseus]|nr:hypothetical protein EIP86_000886 [Pleurotus ostreatoroseus]
MGDDQPWRTIPACGDCPSYKTYTGPINKPELDTRDYRILELPNKLQAVLVHDATADKAAACVHVATGHLLDPGSTPFPGEADFLSFISSNGGSRNATTAADWQDYWFSINPAQLSGGLARLAAFFHSPLFTASLTSREMYAVDSENKRNLQNDSRRAFQIDKALSVPGHPWTKFGTGNVASLTEAAKKKLKADGIHVADGEKPDGDGGPVGREVRRRLIEWWEREYCAGRMALAVVGKESIEELTKLVVPLFSPIPNRGLDPRPAFKEPIWGDEHKGTIVFVKTVKDFREFEVTWHIPQQPPLFQTRPASCITHLLGHEGPGSIYAYLKKKGWLLSLSASTSSRNRTRQTLSIEGRLTREGYLHYKEVLLAVFNYMSMVRAFVLERYHFEEMAQMSSISFRFREKSQPHVYAKALGMDMLEPYPLQELLSRGALNREWDEPAVRELLELLRPELGRVFLLAKDHDDAVVDTKAEWDKEKWYGTEYHVDRLDRELLQKVRSGSLDAIMIIDIWVKANDPNDNNELFLPPPNPFIPENLSVNKQPIATPAKAPTVLRETDSSILWYKKDDQFWVPKARFIVNVLSPLAYVTPRNAVMNRLLVELLNDALAEMTYHASLAGLDYSVASQTTGLYISFGGYNDKLSILVKTVVEKLKNFSIDQARLEVMTEKLSQSLENFYLGQPSNLADYFTSYLLSPVSWSPRERLAEIPFITATDIDQYRKEFLSKIYLQGLITGNVEAEEGIQVLDQVESTLGARSLSLSERPLDRSLLLPQGSNIITLRRHDNPKETNSALTYYCQFGDLSDSRLRAILKLIVHILKEPVFSQLRTVEQLGYVVSSAMWASVGSMGFGFNLQSLKAPSYLEERVDSFITSYRNTLANMSDEDLQAKKEALVLKLLETPKNLGEETRWFWYYIDQGYDDFLRDDTDAATIQTLQHSDILDAYDTYLMPTSPVRKKLSTHLVSQQLDESTQIIPQGTVVVRDEDEVLFKRSLNWSSAATPVPRAEGGLLNPDEVTKGAETQSRL